MPESVVEGPPVELSGPVSLVGAQDHPHAARRLAEGLAGSGSVDASEEEARTNVRLVEDGTLPEGAYRIRASTADGRTQIELAGGHYSGVIRGVEAMLRAAEPAGAGMRLPWSRAERAPALPYRMFWTWDHSTHWDVDTVGQQETGAFNPYMKQPEAFVSDYRRMIDFSSRHGIGGIVVYGLLRDSHGGIEAANEVCRYGRERGVRVLAGVAVNSYGGIYYEGDHPYNLATWLRHHPELAADIASLPGFAIDDYGFLPFPRGEYSMAALSDRPEMERWHLDGIDWLLDTLDVDGVNLEFGDYAGNDAMADMRRLLPRLVERIHAHRTDLWVVTELVWDFLAEPEAPARVADLPDGSAYQFTYNRSYWPRLRDRLTREAVERLPTRVNLIRPHAGSQWNRQRYAFMAPHYAELAGLSVRTGLQGGSIFGEVGDYSVPNELSYLAYARFSLEEELTWEAFMREEVEPRLGGADAAERYLALLGHVDADDLGPAELESAREEVRATAAALADPARRRWSWLEERLSRRIHARLGR